MEMNTIVTYLKDRILSILNLKLDMAGDAAIIAEIKSGIELRGATLWILACAIIIASVGLNINSTAVIIGAMLISPLMGPIVGVGLGLSSLDLDLFRASFRNLSIAAVISLFTSTCYFALTPLSSAASELLARTYPTIWDAFIAFFGGIAGMVGATRKAKGNIIPGVAIATA